MMAGWESFLHSISEACVNANFWQQKLRPASYPGAGPGTAATVIGQPAIGGSIDKTESAGYKDTVNSVTAGL